MVLGEQSTESSAKIEGKQGGKNKHHKDGQKTLAQLKEEKVNEEGYYSLIKELESYFQK